MWCKCCAVSESMTPILLAINFPEAFVKMIKRQRGTPVCSANSANGASSASSAHSAHVHGCRGAHSAHSAYWDSNRKGKISCVTIPSLAIGMAQGLIID